MRRVHIRCLISLYGYAPVVTCEVHDAFPTVMSEETALKHMPGRRKVWSWLTTYYRPALRVSGSDSYGHR